MVEFTLEQAMELSTDPALPAAGDPANYWFDAREDEGLSSIDFTEFDPSLLPDLELADDGFLGEIDRILESISCDQAPPAPTQADPPKEGCVVPVQVSRPVVECEPYSGRTSYKRSGAADGGERGSKRVRGGGDRYREPLLRRHREDAAAGGWRRRDSGRGRKRERESYGPRDRDRGYWERDRSGKLVFRAGTWEADPSREVKRVRIDGGCGQEPLKGVEERKEKLPEEKARQYQLDVLEQAKKKNTIAFLETGAGKTLIAMLLMKSVCSDMLRENKKMLAIFLVPKVPLVYQQAEVIRERTGYKVGHYCGEMGQDFWDSRKWQLEFESKQVLVMTAQILLNILRHSIIRMEAIHLLILDECHHAVKKHPYSLVMSEFYHTTPKDKRPAVFGMTASPVNLKGVSSQMDCAIKIQNLESKLDAVVYTVKDRKELEKHVPMPSEEVVQYDKAATLWSLQEQIKQMETAVEEAAHSSSRRSKWQFMGARDAGSKEELRLVYGVSERTESDGAANLIQKLRAINYALGELGQWCAYKVAQSFLTALQNDERANYQLDVKFQESYLKKVVALLQCQLVEGAADNRDAGTADVNTCEGQGEDDIEEGELPDSHAVCGGEHVDVIIGAAVADGKVTPKVQALIKILLKYQHTDDFRAIIFVERVVAALVLPKVFLELPSLNFVKCASLIGHNNNHEMRTSQMQDTIAKFRDGRVTLLVATSVAEEGLDIRQCNVVIRFDLAKTVLAYIQSRGRARKPGSDYILMLERGNLSHEAFLRNARNSEETLRKEAIERTDLSHLKGSAKLASVDSLPGSMYQVESTGAVVSLNSAVGLVHFYCSQLPSDRYSILRPEFIMERHEKPGMPDFSSLMSQPRVVSSKMSPPLAVGEPSPPIPPVRDPAATVSEMDDRWSRMLPELLGEIIRRVEASEEQWPLRKDVVSCACVCRRWRYVTAGVIRPPVETGKITFPSSLKQPGPRESPIQCFIQRNKKNSTFYLYLSLTETFLDKGKFLLAARRFRHGAHTQYILSLDADDLSQGSNAYVGKLRSDFLGTNFIAYDSRPPYNGAKASSSRASRRFASKQISPQVPAGNFEIGRISYKFNLLKSRGPRRMQCVLQCPSASETPEEDSLKPKAQNPAGALVLRNKAPRWHERLQYWCLNFRGRVTVASVKNFQLVATADPSQPEGKGDSETVLLQFGKVGNDMFTMDYRQPLSAFQAFAICLTSFGTKYGCE